MTQKTKAAKTEEEIRTIVNALPRKVKEKQLYSYSRDLMLPEEGRSLQEFIQVLEELKTNLANQHNVPIEEIYIKIKDRFWDRDIIFYSARIESNEELEKRKQRSLTSRMSALKKRQKVEVEKERKQRQWRKDQLKKIVDEFGDEIYDVFKEIKSNG